MTYVNERAQAGMGNPEWQQNWTLDGLQLYGEIMELSTQKIWLCQQSFTPEQYDALQLPDGFIKSGSGYASHDAAFFRRPPNAEQDTPLETLDVDGRVFSQMAMPGEVDPDFTIENNGLLLLKVHKHHSVMFAKGRTLAILSMGDGRDYVPQISKILGLPGLPESQGRVLPKGWTIREVTLQEDLFVDVPFPARVCFFTSGHSFQGPLTLSI